MALEIIPIGGFSEIGRNCAALKVDDEVVILDLGLHMEKYIEYTDSDDIVDMSSKSLMDIGAIPDVRTLGNLSKKVVAVCLGHAHLDHMGAVPFLGNKFDCPIYGAPFTMEVLKAMIKDQKIDLRNDLIEQKENSRFRVSKNIEIEFINVTHSTPHAVLIAVHTKYGVVLYANEFKLDEHPTLGNKTNIQRLKELKIKALIVDCLYSTNPTKTPSEMIAKQMLKEILLENDTKGRNIFVTTFSSHIARVKTIKEIGRKMGRKVVFLGRSLAKYALAAQDANITNFSDITIVKYSSKVKKFLSKLSNTDKYLFVVTGHQGEPKAILSRIINNGFFNFKPGDMVIFSCHIIPVPINYDNRKKLEDSIKQKHVRIFRDIHVSGHASREDQRDFFAITKPEFIIPIHGDIPRMEAMKELALEEGYKEKDVFLLKNKEIIKIN
ncbi:MBL fold metallo-hydrolase [Candidatus Woesearchaeota archaeon]|nr:MBL fold metallo-hydrolase [Candidatus Woesearchaeota archaeon]